MKKMLLRKIFDSYAKHLTILCVALLLSGNAMAQKSVCIWPGQNRTPRENYVPTDYESFKEVFNIMMQMVPDKESCDYTTTFNWGDDEIMNANLADAHLTYSMDKGNLADWYLKYTQHFLNSTRSGHYYLNAWYCINLANVSLANIDNLTDCTAEQKNEIEGSLYFMRAWWHQELMTYFGAMPYVDYELPFDEITKLPCLSAKEAAKKCAEDFGRAADLLPMVSSLLNFDSSTNQSEAPNRMAALGYKGKILLWAASPLNHHGAQTGALANGNTYRYDTEMAKLAAEALGTAINLSNDAQSPFKLVRQAEPEGPALVYEQVFEGLTSHPFSSLISGVEQYDADGLWIHNETAYNSNVELRYVVGDVSNVLNDSKNYMLRVTIKGSTAGSLDAHIRVKRGAPVEGQAVCSVPFTEEWSTVDCPIDNDKIVNRSLLIFCSGKTVGDIHIKSIQVLEMPEDTNTELYPDLFYTLQKNWKHPGGTEALFANNNQNVNTSNWNFSKTWGPKVAGLVAHDQIIHMPTANYVNYAYGMANGLPITDPESGFDPTHPYKNRDPRFYNDIVYDGYKYVEDTENLNSEQKKYQYMNLYTGGNMRDEELGSRTGYFCKKLVPTGCNEGDRYYEWSYNLACNLPYMRLADVYLMYAEACAAYGSASTSNTCTLTAEDAINVLRDRVGAGHVAQKIAADNQTFMDEVRRERACELAFEGHRWSDLSRWLLLSEAPYNKKTSQEFKRVGNGSKTEPMNNEVSDWSESEILTRNYDASHYFFPLDPNKTPDTDVIYSEDGKTLISYPKYDKAETFVVPETVEILGENCFNYNSNLKNIILHDGIKEIGAGAFQYTQITEILLPSQITSLPDNCFANTQLKHFTSRTRAAGDAGLAIPSRITSIGNKCFYNCANIENLTIENGVQSLGENCFRRCDNIKTVNVPASVSHIGKNCFSQGGEFSFAGYSAGSLESITVDPANSNYTSVDGILYDKAMTHLMQAPYNLKGELTIPEGVEVVDENAINYCFELTKVTMPASLKTIEYVNFNNCMKLNDIAFLGTEIPEWSVFVSNFFSSGITLHVPESSLDAYKNAFLGMHVIQVVPNGSEPTYGPNDLVLIGNQYTLSSGYDFMSHVQEIYVDGVKKNLDDNYFSGWEIVLRMDDQFTEATPVILNFKTTKIILPQTVKRTLGTDADWESSYAKQVVLPESLEELGENSFIRFPGWTMTIPKNVNTIAEGCFRRNQLGEFIVDPENFYFTAVDGILYDKDMKTLISYPTFKRTMDYVVPETVEEVRAYAMADPSLYGNDATFKHGTLTLPAGLKSLGDFAFEAFHPSCVICYAKEVPECGYDAFGYTYSGSYPNTVLYVPAESIDAYKAHDQWGRFLHILPLDEVANINQVENTNHRSATYKYIQNGRVVIVKNGRKFTASGMEIK